MRKAKEAVVNALIDKLENGQSLTDDDCIKGGFCLSCRGLGFTYDYDDEIECEPCEGTGVTAEHAIKCAGL